MQSDMKKVTWKSFLLFFHFQSLSFVTEYYTVKYVLFFILLFLFVNWAVYFFHFRCAAGRTGSALCPPISCVACFPARQRDRNFNRTNCQLGGSTY